MKKSTRLSKDPVVDEVRTIRRKLWTQAGSTVEGLIDLLNHSVPPRRRRRVRRTTRKS